MVSQSLELKPSKVRDPEDIRKQFFRTQFDTEETALEFLNGVGVWDAVEDRSISIGKDGIMRSGGSPVGIREMQLPVAIGHRLLFGRALTITLGDLRREQAFWRSILRSPAKLRAAYARTPPTDSVPARKSAFAFQSAFGNTLPVHMEWERRTPCAVIQPVTGREMLIALAWLDLVSSSECRICQKCDIEYTHGGSRYCSVQCERANTMRNYRLRRKEQGTK
jgi:hypothetical protein